jgi:hypothetical protein
MPTDKDRLDEIARAYIAPMTSIRGRRVHRLVLRELARFDYVLPVATEDGAPALLALGDDGSCAFTCTDGTGKAADVIERRANGATATVSYDLRKDSLPVVAETKSPNGLSGLAGSLEVSVSGIPRSQQKKVRELLEKLHN